MTKPKKPRVGARGSSVPAPAISHAQSPATSRRKPKQNRWNDELRAIFIEELYETCCVREALKKTGMSVSGLYKHRANTPKFREMWDEALDAGYAMLESEMLDRARNGQIQEVAGKGGEIIRIKVISNQLGLSLLRMHIDRVAKIRAARAERPFAEDAAEVRREILARLERMRVNRANNRAETANAEQAQTEVIPSPCSPAPQIHAFSG